MNDSIFPTPLDTPLHSPQVAETLLERALPFVRTLRDYRFEYFRPDFIAGLTTAMFTIPQGMAYALIADFRPSLVSRPPSPPRSSAPRSGAPSS